MKPTFKFSSVLCALFAFGVDVGSILPASASEPIRRDRVPMTGLIVRFDSTELIDVRLKIGDSEVGYSIVGNSKSTGLIKKDVDVSRIKVRKTCMKEDEAHYEPIENLGKFQASLGTYKFKETKLAGTLVSGSVSLGKIDFGLNLADLTVDGVKSVGRLDYDSHNSAFKIDQAPSFGGTPIRSSKPSSTEILVTDGSADQTLSLNFGELVIEGKVVYGGSTDFSKKDLARMDGHVQWIITKQNGNPLTFSSCGETETADEKALRKWIAFLTVTGHLLFSSPVQEVP